jgi:dTMP kinase
MLIDSTFSPKSSRGFIVLEGLNGAGKTTLQQKLNEFIQGKGFSTLLTREPGSPHTSLGKVVRSIVLNGAAGEVSTRAEALLFAADRAEHVEKVLKPTLQEGKIVLCDRFFYSSVAFQGEGRNLGADYIYQLNQFAIAGLLPDLVLLIDLPPHIGLERTRNRNSNQGLEESDRLEQETLDFHQRIREGFLKLAERDATPFLLLSGTDTPEGIFEKAYPFVEKILIERISQKFPAGAR